MINKEIRQARVERVPLRHEKKTDLAWGKRGSRGAEERFGRGGRHERRLERVGARLMQCHRNMRKRGRRIRMDVVHGVQKLVLRRAGSIVVVPRRVIVMHVVGVIGALQGERGMRCMVEPVVQLRLEIPKPEVRHENGEHHECN